MSDKPSYLKLLNAIAVNEARAHRYLTAWIGTTDDLQVKTVLSKVAAREGEHGMSFAKRINELGYEIKEKDDPAAAQQLSIAASSDYSDAEKFEKLGLHELDKALTVFDDIFKDHSIDIRTGELLGRYITEEFDSARLLRCCYEQLASWSPTEDEKKVDDGASHRLESLASKVDQLQRTIDDLRHLVS